MSSAAVEQVPPPAAGAAAVFVDIDLEANNATTRGTTTAAAVSSAREQATAAVVQATAAVDIESGSAVSSPGESPSSRTTAGGAFSHGDALALLLGLVSVVCLTIVMGELLNGAAPNPTSTSLFVLCTVSCVWVLRRQRAAAAASRALEHHATILSTSHHPRPPSTLDHEARRSLFDYFVFSHPAKDRGQENKDEDDVKGSSSLSSSSSSSSELQDIKKSRDVKEREVESATTTTTVSVVAAATAAPVAADVKVPLSEDKTGMLRGTPEGWTTAAACVVCFGEYAPGDNLCRLPCRHTYHAKCIDQWLDKANHPCCPMCKADLLALHDESSGGGAVATIASDTANNNSSDTANNSSSSSSNNNDNSINNINSSETSQPPAHSREEDAVSA